MSVVLQRMVAVSGLIAASACSYHNVSCTAVGCESSVSVTADDATVSRLVPGSAAAVCVDGTCQSSPIKIVDDPGPVQFVVVLLIPGVDQSKDHTVTVSVPSSSGEPILGGPVMTHRIQPNGKSCEPTCTQATIDLRA